MTEINPKFEILICSLLIIFSVIVIYFSLDIPKSDYEPLGSAALPISLSIIMIIFSIFIMANSLIKLRKEGKIKFQEIRYKPKHLNAVGVFISTIIFISILENKILHFLPTCIVYLILVCFMIDPTKKKLPWFISFSVILSLISFYVFTKFFYVDLT